MKRVMILLLLFPLCGWAEDVTLDWTNATEQETCTNSGPTTIDGVNIWQLVATVDAPLQTYVIEDQPPGDYTYAATSFNAGGESRLSGKTTKTVTAFVTTSELVFYPVAQPDSVLLLGIGTVPLGTPCDPSVSVNGHNAVDRSLVQWAGTAEPLLVVAQCG